MTTPDVNFSVMLHMVSASGLDLNGRKYRGNLGRVTSKSFSGLCSHLTVMQGDTDEA